MVRVLHFDRRDLISIKPHRQDVKHVQIMKLCAREFVKDLIAEGNKGQIANDWRSIILKIYVKRLVARKR